jgi:hypothetical protein
MFEKPTPLREALREALEKLMDTCGRADEYAFIAECLETEDFTRVTALIEQIPLVFEAREPDVDS